MKLKINMSAQEYLSFARFLQGVPADLLECPVAQAAQREGLKAVFKKAQSRIIDGIQGDTKLSLSAMEAWALYSVLIDVPRHLFGTYENMIIDKIIRSIHQHHS
jgi:hypothetical protein